MIQGPRAPGPTQSPALSSCPAISYKAQLFLDMYCTYVLLLFVNFSPQPLRSTLCRHREGNPPTQLPLNLRLTNAPSRNPFPLTSLQMPGVCTPSIPELGTLCLRAPVTVTSASPVVSMRFALFHFPYSATPLFATLTKTTGVYTNSSHFGTSSSALRFDSPPHDCLVDYGDTFFHTVGPSESSVHSTARPGSAA
jgi:hypothetical protein